MFEIYCSREKNHFDIIDTSGKLITDYRKITSVDGNRSIVFQQFFDMGKIENICQAHGIRFKNR